jgi:hypothetical protein
VAADRLTHRPAPASCRWPSASSAGLSPHVVHDWNRTFPRVRLQHRVVGLFRLKKERLIVSRHEQRHQAHRTDASNAHYLDRKIVEAEPIQQHAVVVSKCIAIHAEILQTRDAQKLLEIQVVSISLLLSHLQLAATLLGCAAISPEQWVKCAYERSVDCFKPAQTSGWVVGMSSGRIALGSSMIC